MGSINNTDQAPGKFQSAGFPLECGVVLGDTLSYNGIQFTVNSKQRSVQ